MYKLWYKDKGHWVYKPLGSYGRVAFRALFDLVTNPKDQITNAWVEFRRV